MLLGRLRPASLLAALPLLLACGRDTPTAPSPSVVRIEALTPSEFRATVGTEVTPAPRVRVRDSDHQPIANTRVTFTALEGRVIGEPSVFTDEAGTAAVPSWVLTETPGPQRLRVRAGNASAVFAALAEAGPAASLVAVGGSAQIGAVGSTLRSTLRVKVTDAFGNAISEAPVTFSVAEGGGSVEWPQAATGPDGIATSGLWTLGPAPGIQRVIAEIGQAQVAFTADACTDCPQLLFARGNIYLYDVGTGEERQLTFDGGRSPAWSPDGERIAFVGPTSLLHAAGGDIYIMNADGSNITRRTVGRSFHSPTWSPNGDSLAVAGDRNGCDIGAIECAIYVLKVASDEEPRRIAAGHDPAWSPNGAEIAYVGNDGLRVASTDGTRTSRLLQQPDEGLISSPSWFPDGSRIAVWQCSRSLMGCALFAVGPTGVTQLTDTVTEIDEFGDVDAPISRTAWSPDGRFIAFTLWHDVVYIPSTGGAPALLIADAESPAWRP